MAYCTATDLRNAMGAKILDAIFDDDGDGVGEEAAITACLTYGSAECDSFLEGEYDATFPLAVVPDVLKFAAVDFCIAYAYRRRPDIVRAMGEAPWTTFNEAAVEKMKRYAASLQRLPAVAGGAPTPSNVGGISYDDSNRLSINSADGTDRTGDF